jgi:hypothetical protein
MERVELLSTVHGDGTLHLTVPAAADGSEKPVRVTIEPTSLRPPTPGEWRQCILDTAGKWQGNFVRPEQGEFETRMPMS